MYKLVNFNGKPVCIQHQIGNVLLSIPFDQSNTDYANFKKEILADEAQLQDADGNVIADAKDYVASLP
jgi:hypothetical protein